MRSKWNEDRILDGILGLATADALGVPVEFSKREKLKHDPVTGMRGFGTHHQSPGTWSDDTSMVLCLWDRLKLQIAAADPDCAIADPDYDGIMRNFADWYLKGAFTPHGVCFDCGITTSQAIMRYQSGTKALDCGGIGERDNGNGSLMRILPIAYYLHARYGDDLAGHPESFDIIHRVSALTHAHKRSLIACGIYICIATALLSGVDLRNAIAYGMRQAWSYYENRPGFREELGHYQRFMEDDFAVISEGSIRSSGYVVDTLEAAIWCLLNTDNYRDCVLKAVNLGKDTDTVAAVAGGLAGLAYGYRSIPQEWLDQLARDLMCYL